MLPLLVLLTYSSRPMHRTEDSVSDGPGMGERS